MTENDNDRFPIEFIFELFEWIDYFMEIREYWIYSHAL